MLKRVVEELTPGPHALELAFLSLYGEAAAIIITGIVDYMGVLVIV